MHKKFIIFEPFRSMNVYIENMKNAWEYMYEPVSNTRAKDNLYIQLNTKAIILNWSENNLTSSYKRQLLKYKLLGIKVLWVFHNKIPHNTIENPQQIKISQKNMLFLAKISDAIIIHSKHSKKYLTDMSVKKNKIYYVPHVNYERQYGKAKELPITYIKKFRFVFFGKISPYKNIELLIQVFQELNLSNCELYIVGNPCNREYGEKIYEMSQNADIHLVFEYLTDYEIGKQIRQGDIVVLPYDLRSSMNSGSMIAAFSNKRTVIISNNAMAKDLSKEDFLYRYEYSSQIEHYEQLKTVMKTAYENGILDNRDKGRAAYEYIRKRNSESVVVRSLKKVISSV